MLSIFHFSCLMRFFWKYPKHRTCHSSWLPFASSCYSLYSHKRMCPRSIRPATGWADNFQNRAYSSGTPVGNGRHIIAILVSHFLAGFAVSYRLCFRAATANPPQRIHLELHIFIINIIMTIVNNMAKATLFLAMLIVSLIEFFSMAYINY